MPYSLTVTIAGSPYEGAEYIGVSVVSLWVTLGAFFLLLDLLDGLTVARALLGVGGAMTATWLLYRVWVNLDTGASGYFYYAGPWYHYDQLAWIVAFLPLALASCGELRRIFLRLYKRRRSRARG